MAYTPGPGTIGTGITTPNGNNLGAELDPNNPNRSLSGQYLGFVTGSDAFNDINQSRFGVQNNFDANQWRYNPDAGAYQINDQAYVNQLGQAIAGAQGRSTPLSSAATINQAPSNQLRADQMQLIGQLQARASGQAPSAAELQLRQGLGAAIAAQRAQAASARGLSPGMAQRLAAQGIAGAQMDTNQQAAILRAQEQAQAEQALGGVLSGARGQDLGVAAQQAGLQQQTNLANQQAEFTNRGQMDTAMANYLGQGFQSEQARQAALAQQQQLAADQAKTAAELAQKTAEENAKRQQEARGGIFKAVSGALGSIKLSDERLKENIASADKDVRGFLDSFNAYRFDYKDPKHGGKNELGVLAQEIERSPTGKSLVTETSEGKALRLPEFVTALAAALKNVHERTKALEGAK